MPLCTRFFKNIKHIWNIQYQFFQIIKFSGIIYCNKHTEKKNQPKTQRKTANTMYLNPCKGNYEISAIVLFLAHTLLTLMKG